MKRTLIALAILLIAVAAIAAPGRPSAPPAAPPSAPQELRGPGGPGGPGGDVLPPRLLAEFLGLSEAQQAQIETLHDTLRGTVEPLVEQQRANREALEAAVAAGNAQRAGELLIANKTLGDQIKAAHDIFRGGFEALLTSEQKAKFAVYQEIVELRREH